MTLSQAYLEWEQETEQRGLVRGIEQGIEQGIQSERRATIENLLQVRFGVLDEALLTIVPILLGLSAQEYTPLLMNLSRAELVARFGFPTSGES